MVELGDPLEKPLKIKKKKKIKANSLIDDGHSDIITTNEVQVASLGNEAPMFVLFEHAVGYALFRLKQYEEVGAALMAEQLRDNLTDFTKFCMNVHLIAFSPFKSAKNALENINYISEGMVHEDLYLFLDTHLPKIKKVLLAVSDSKLANSLSENKELNINCIYSGLVPDLMRGIRQHFTKFFKDFKQSSTTSLQLDESKGIKAQLGLAHSYSRAKIKFNVNRVDNMIVQCIAILDQLDKDINKFCMRLREWYSYHFPELYKLVPENLLYAKVVKCVGDRKDLFQASDPQTIAAIRENLEILLPDSAIVDAIIKIAKSSMGMDISPLDLNMVIKFTDRVVALGELRKALANYLNQKMKCVAPNLAELLGDTVSARLISHAGSLSNLAKCPASTIQILGAEKALFRALKSRSGNTPKYGLLFHSAFISKAGPTNKGKVSRYLANKCAIASRIDCFSDFACPIYGQFLKAQVENRIRFLETGEEPIKNDDLMSQAKEKAHDYIEAAKHLQEAVSSSSVKKVKKKKKKIQEEIPLMNGDAEININHTSSFADQLDQVENAMEVTPGKKKKNKKRKIVQDDGNNDLDIMLNGSSNFSTFTETKLERVTVNEQELISTQVGLKPPKKKKKNLSLNVILNNMDLFEGAIESLPPNLKNKALFLMGKRKLITDTNIHRILHPGTQEIDLSQCNITDHSIKQLSSLCPLLTSINLECLSNADGQTNYHISSKSLVLLAEHCPNLQEVIFTRCDIVTDSVIHALAANCSQLSRVGIGGCKLISDRSLQHLGYHASNLSCIDFSYTLVTNKGVLKLVTGKCKNTLREVLMNGCVNLTDAAVEAFVSFTGSLCILCFQDCPLMTFRSTIALARITSHKTLQYVTFTIY